jgi:hypothetical protein
MTADDVRPVGDSGAAGHRGGPPAADPEAAKPSGDAAGSGEYDKGDFDSRFVREPEWGLKQFKDVFGKYTKTNQTLKESQSILDFARNVGGGDVKAGFERIQGWLGQYNTVRSNPEMARIVDQYLATGRLSDVAAKPAEPAGDEWEDEATKALRAQVAALEGRLAEIQGSHQRLESSSAQESLRKHLSTFFERVPLPEERRKEVLASMLRDVESYQHSDNGRTTLRAMMSPEGYRTVRTLALAALDDADLEAAGEKVYLRTLERKKGTATDAMPSVRTTGREAIESTDASTAIRRFAQELGLDLDRESLAKYM